MGKLPCPGLLRAAGFRRGDLVLSVNGAKPTSIARAVSIYSAARSKGTAEVIVRRGKKGKKKKVRLRYRFTD
jgi:type II secretory pathway component PulC